MPLSAFTLNKQMNKYRTWRCVRSCLISPWQELRPRTGSTVPQSQQLGPMEADSRFLNPSRNPSLDACSRQGVGTMRSSAAWQGHCMCSRRGQLAPSFLRFCQSPRNRFYWPSTRGFLLTHSRSQRSLLHEPKPPPLGPLSILEHDHDTNPQTQAQERHRELTRNELHRPHPPNQGLGTPALGSTFLEVASTLGADP